MKLIACVCLFFAFGLPVHATGLENSLLSGSTQRFTAFRQYEYTKDWRLIKVSEIPNGSHLLDLSIATDRPLSTVVDVKANANFTLVKKPVYSVEALQKGFDFQFDIQGLNSVLLLNTKNSVLASIYYDDQKERNFEIHFVRSVALLCKTLSEIKNRAQNKMAASIFREVLVAAIRSYAGTSYSGGTFAGTSASGTAFSGTYTRYDSSWLGEHYARGLDAVFDGVASISQINTQMENFQCDEAQQFRVNANEQPSSVNNFEKGKYELPK